MIKIRLLAAQLRTVSRKSRDPWRESWPQHVSHSWWLATAVLVPRKIAQSRGKLLQVCEVLERSRYDNNRKYIKLSSFLLLEQLIPGSKKKDRKERPLDMHFVSIYSVFAMWVCLIFWGGNIDGLSYCIIFYHHLSHIFSHENKRHKRRHCPFLDKPPDGAKYRCSSPGLRKELLEAQLEDPRVDLVEKAG